jgi:BMFP domain-containing protein YqiC
MTAMNRFFPTDPRAPFIVTRQAMSRRRFLQGAGIALSLPLLDAMLPPFARAATSSSPLVPGAKPRRLFGICNNLGLRPDLFFPKDAGAGYTASPYLQLLQEHRRDFTVFSGVSHPNVDGGHPSDIAFLTAAPHPASSSFRNTISLDQHIAERIGTLTRFPSLTLAVNGGGRALSWTGTGVAIPPEQSAASVFNQLFLQGTAEQIEAQIRELDRGRSILDAVGEQAKDLQRNVGARDRTRLEQYFTSVRDLEHRLQESRGWERKPKPIVKVPAPVDPASPAQYMAKVEVMYDLVRLAFETDSTRAVTLMLNSVGTPVITDTGETLTDSYHNLSHHGKAEEKLSQLRIIDESHMKKLAKLFADLKAVREGEDTLLDRTMILYGSNLGDANAHSTINMPTIFGGGGFRHGQHLSLDPEGGIYPLPNRFVSILQRIGLEEDKFASSTGTMRGLAMT